LLLVIFEEKRDKKFIIYFLIIIAAVYITNDIFLKNLFHRSRPLPAEKRSLERRANSDESSSKVSLGGPSSTDCPSDFSFPSGHAATAFASAAILSFFDKKRRGGYYLIAFLIALSRVYLFCHFFFDVVAGGLIGWLTTKIILIGQKTHSVE